MRGSLLKTVFILFGGCAWAFLVFLCTGYLTFPGDALADRAEYEIHQNSKKQYIAELGDLSPWWFGASTPEVKLFGKAGRDGSNPLLVYATDARVAVNPLSLLFAAPAVSGSITLGDNGTLYYDVETASKDSTLTASKVELTGSNFPVNELLAMIPNAEVAGSGNADIDITLKAPEGLAKATGKITLKGRSINLIKPVVADFPVGRDVAISDLDLLLTVDDGKAKIKSGKLKSDVADVNITGTMTLNDNVMMSQVDLKLEVELDESMAMLTQMFKKAEKNGKLEFSCKGRLNALDRGCRAGSGAVSKSRARPRPRPTPSTKGVGISKPRPPGLSTEDREQRKKELQERLRKRREERRAGKAADKGKEEDLEDEEDEELEDEEDEELEDEEDEELEDEDIADE